MINKFKKLLSLATLFALAQSSAFAQGGTTGINAATSSLEAYVDPVSSLILVIGAVVGLIGGVRVYIKWNSGDQDITTPKTHLIYCAVIIRLRFRSGTER